MITQVISKNTDNDLSISIHLISQHTVADW
jgi:hypothetical protein